MNRITPNREQFEQLARSPDTGPVVMLNLLKFRASTGDGRDSGAAAYARYGDAAVEMIENRGGRVLWAGRADQILIGDPDEPWDQVLLVQYPTRQAFIEMVTTPEYVEAHEHREQGLERTIVVACTPRVDRIGAR
ncbi:MAG TPA: DUF1330 domain-containing protein [Acidimicrobiia bacterium]